MTKYVKADFDNMEFNGVVYPTLEDAVKAGAISEDAADFIVDEANWHELEFCQVVVGEDICDPDELYYF